MVKSRCLAIMSATFYALTASTQIFAQGAVPPPGAQISADCVRPVYASDQLVCGDNILRQMDTQLADLLRQRNRTRSTALFENDDMWFKRRSRCAFEAEHRSCLIEAYTDRIIVMEALSTVDPRLKSAMCKNLKDARQVSMQLARNKPLVIWDNYGQLIGVATEKIEGKIWKPLLTFTASGKHYKFENHDGRRFTCKLR